MENGMRLPLNPAFGKALAPIVTECVTANSYYAPNTGRGIRAGIWAGAKMDSSCAPMVFPFRSSALNTVFAGVPQAVMDTASIALAARSAIVFVAFFIQKTSFLSVLLLTRLILL